ncbi:hypothetical protein LU196_08850 [Pantoea sp. Mb-10]|uniref:hypothetical protein n=1 Tax=unclassified Pantoea TaxID=2630326 RepID=UPI001E39212C|nr:MULTISPECIES: hypothetical protein [unclassified Pantoea]MCE0490153.1 hypothetical protein [Pantoea sp. Mb-10]MCE0501284.1 hypothetical protein [Pantoea sp. Pb-8]
MQTLLHWSDLCCLALTRARFAGSPFCAGNGVNRVMADDNAARRGGLRLLEVTRKQGRRMGETAVKKGGLTAA